MWICLNVFSPPETFFFNVNLSQFFPQHWKHFFLVGKNFFMENLFQYYYWNLSQKKIQGKLFTPHFFVVNFKEIFFLVWFVLDIFFPAIFLLLTFGSLVGCGVFHNCFGVCPNSLICAIIAAFSIGSTIFSKSTAPSYVKW